MTDDDFDVTEDDLAVAAAATDAIDEALASTSDDLTDTSALLVTANGAVAQLASIVSALRDVAFLALDTPDERRLAVMLYNRLGPIEELAKMHRRHIESALRRRMIDESATKLSIGDDRVVSLSLPESKYAVDGQGLYNGLRALVGTVLTERQLEEAIHPEVRYVANHTKLNALHKNMGAKVQAVIDENRTKIAGDPAMGKVVIPPEPQR